jgi:hypothetical protein
MSETIQAFTVTFQRIAAAAAAAAQLHPSCCCTHAPHLITLYGDGLISSILELK